VPFRGAVVNARSAVGRNVNDSQRELLLSIGGYSELEKKK
jgi:hypothetical protein